MQKVEPKIQTGKTEMDISMSYNSFTINQTNSQGRKYVILQCKAITNNKL
ncbi:hypothetical protein Fmac_006260 [Flemingia macrophylla]|uniref:Uncharacterized protein n=1 Tax=Flemingia macrophylla TaxID=520843 RepID=A0ABD1NCV6_9FABA